MRFQSGFRSAVTDHAGTQHVVEACRDVNDAAPLAPHHFRHETCCDGERRYGIDLEELLRLFLRNFPEADRIRNEIPPYGAGGHAGIIHQDIDVPERSEEHTSELQSLLRISYAVFRLKKKKTQRL